MTTSPLPEGLGDRRQKEREMKGLRGSEEPVGQNAPVGTFCLTGKAEAGKVFGYSLGFCSRR